MIPKKHQLFTAALRAFAVLATCGLCHAQTARPNTSEDDLARDATDPTASLMSFGFIGSYVGGYQTAIPGQPDERSEFKFQPILPFAAFGHPNILRMSFPFQTEGRGEEGISPISVFNLTVFSPSWGRWGIGPVMNFDTTGDLPDAFAIGPAVGFVYPYSKRLNLGLFAQNLFAGDTAVSQIQPIIAYQLGDGWTLSAGDLQFVYDWQASRWLSVPVGFQIGKVQRIAGLPMRFALNPQYNLLNGDGLEEWKISFAMSFLIPGF